MSADNGQGKKWIGWLGILIGPAFFLLAAFLYWGPDLADLPEFTATPIDTADLSTAPRRAPLGDPPQVMLGGFEQTCMSCHRMFPPRDIPPGTRLLQHTHVELQHGINDRCRNCHDVEDRNRLRLQGGKTLPYAEVVTLCSECHGPTYKDWVRGMHGRTNGYWNASLGEVKRMGCTYCHDPHKPSAPAMDPLRPMPGPHTLRTVIPPERVEHAEDDPLRRALLAFRHADEAKRSAHEEDPSTDGDSETDETEHAAEGVE